MRRRFGFVMVLAAAWFLTPAGALYAQADRDTLLPDLAPRELEILGNLEITFPQLRRQPLTGFNPPPRIYEVPRGYRPWTGEYKQASADLPGTSLIQPVSPPRTISVGQHPHDGELSVGIGRYLSREVRAQARFKLGSNLVVYGNGFHEGLDKFKPFPLKDTLDTEAPEQTYDGLVGLTYRMGSTSVGVEGSGFFRELDLYGARPDTAPFSSPERDGQGLGGKVWVMTGTSSRLPVRIAAGYRSNTFETTRPDLDESLSIDGSQLTLEGDTRIKTGGPTLEFDGKVWVDSRSGNPTVDEDVVNSPPSASELTTDLTTYMAGGEYRINAGRRGVLRFGAQLHGYSLTHRHPAMGVVGDANVSQSKIYVAPRVSYVNLIASGMELYVKNSPIVGVPDQQDMFELNPFLVDGALSLPELSIVNVEGGLVFYRGPVRVAAKSGITTYESFRYFVSADSPYFGDGFFDVQYRDADVLFAGGDLGVTFPGQFSATVTGRWQSAKLKNDVDVPNYPGFEGGLRASYVFAADRGLVQLDGRFVGSRNVDSAASETLSGYLDAALLASYYFENGIGVFGRIQTMTGDSFERWVGYPVADWVTLAGIRLRW